MVARTDKKKRDKSCDRSLLWYRIMQLYTRYAFMSRYRDTHRFPRARALRHYPLCVSVLHTRNMENLPNSLPDSFYVLFIVNIIRAKSHIIIEFAEKNINRAIVRRLFSYVYFTTSYMYLKFKTFQIYYYKSL